MKQNPTNANRIVTRKRQTTSKDIAIIGLSGKYPMAEDVEIYWNNLKSGKDSIREIPVERWSIDAYEGQSYCKWGGFVDDVDKFDPLFFNISPKEAEVIDPQERLFLETAYLTLEDAGYTGFYPRTKKKKVKPNRVGVFVGVTTAGYSLLGSAYSLPWSIPNRVSYTFNFQGPSMPVDTACSSSLTAIHLACESIIRNECELALAGGVNLYLHPQKYVSMCTIGMPSPDGVCRSFGEGANGLVPGEGVGAILLKPLDQALAENDKIYAVIKGSSINSGGKTSGYTVPNPNAQSALILDSLQKAQIDPRTISYLEAHGTGTSLGDPVEIRGLNMAFRQHTRDRQFCALGSVKSNIGHAESAAGIAGITKILLQLKHKWLVPTLHAEKPNPAIDFESSPFYLQIKGGEWNPLTLEIDGNTKQVPRRAAISSFGAGGANAHLIIEEFDQMDSQARKDDSQAHIIVLSARNKEQLQIYTQKMEAFLERSSPENPARFIEEIAFTLQVGREAMEERLAAIVSDLSELKETLSNYRMKQFDSTNLFHGSLQNTNENPLNLIDGEAGEAYFYSIIEKRDLAKLAKFWVSGAEIDWRLMYGQRFPRMIFIPGYPFKKKRYWISELSLFDSVLKHEFPAPDFHSQTEGYAELERLCSLMLLQQFQNLGVFRKASESYKKGDLKKKLKLIPAFDRLLDALLLILRNNGWIDLQDQNLTSSKALEENGLKKELLQIHKKKQDLMARFSELKPAMKLLDTCFERYQEILQGRVAVTDVLFPNSSMELVEDVYRGSNFTRYFNKMVAQSVEMYCKAVSRKQEKISILEIGAGTGGTSKSVCPAIVPFAENLRYVYSDISSAFLLHGEKTLAGKYRFLEFSILDIEKAPNLDTMPVQGFDLIIAANVLHATKRIQNTIRNVRSLLKPGGWLVLSEVTAVQNWATLTFGLLDGWWLFDDDQARIQGSPLLTTKMWQHALKTAGFSKAAGLYHPGSEEKIFQNVIIAENSYATGMACQKPKKKAIKSKSVPEIKSFDGIRNNREIRSKIGEILSETLALDENELNEEKSFSEYGIDSIIGGELIKKINDYFDISLKSTILYDYSSLSTLSAFISDQFGSEIVINKQKTETP
ncbi:MAG: beta-ketoacyl synthase N-terminal-like domain-containing protein, partial [Desulfobacteraceae bacterium]